jgi:hypothetical protein
MQEVSGSIPLGSTKFWLTRYGRSAWAALAPGRTGEPTSLQFIDIKRRAR